MIRSTILILALTASVAFAAEEETKRLTEATTVLNEMMGAGDKGIPTSLVDSSSCIVIIPGLKKGVFGQGYPTLSWYSLLAGMGLFPEPQDMRPPTPEEAQHDLTQIDNLLERSAMNYPDQRELLQRIPPRPTEPSLQVYLW